MSVKKFAIGLLMSAALLGVLTGCSGQSSGSDTTAVDPTTTKAQIFFILRNDNGASGELVGCGDTLAGQDLATTLENTTMEEAVTAQLAVKDETVTVNGQQLYNPLSRCDLTVNSIQEDDKGTVTMDLSGTVVGGSICDQIRMRTQLASCIWQYDGVKDVEITLDGVDFQTVLTRAPSPDSGQ